MLIAALYLLQGKQKKTDKMKKKLAKLLAPECRSQLVYKIQITHEGVCASAVVNVSFVALKMAIQAHATLMLCLCLFITNTLAQ